VLSREATNTNFIVFGSTQPGLEPTIYRTRGGYVDHYATDAFFLHLSKKPTIAYNWITFLFLVARNYIHCCKWTDTKPFLNIFKVKVKQKEKIEKINALVENKMYKHDNK
jgi:hypothetical protein